MPRNIDQKIYCSLLPHLTGSSGAAGRRGGDDVLEHCSGTPRLMVTRGYTCENWLKVPYPRFTIGLGGGFEGQRPRMDGVLASAPLPSGAQHGTGHPGHQAIGETFWYVQNGLVIRSTEGAVGSGHGAVLRSRHALPLKRGRRLQKVTKGEELTKATVALVRGGRGIPGGAATFRVSSDLRRISHQETHCGSKDQFSKKSQNESNILTIKPRVISLSNSIRELEMVTFAELISPVQIFNELNLKTNPAKSTFIHFGLRQSQSDYSLTVMLDETDIDEVYT
ncbi:hypothetical protein J6590_018594 [Homalodisca vitripennis]|nr:hypothetical protein J6590_018594 [Homalodisca vitripennis]